MRRREVFSAIAVPKDAWAILRVDGRGFTKYTQTAGYTKPFDEAFSAHMVRCAKRLLVEFDAVYATTHSDEISIVLKPDTSMFNRRAEKLASVAAGITSAEFGQAFDGRVSVATYRSEVVDYFSWRQADASSNALSSLTYWTLRRKGKSQGDATSILNGLDAPGRRNLLLDYYGLDADEMDPWMLRGLDLSWRHEEKQGYNPQLGEAAVAMRNLIDLRSEVPSGDEYRSWLDLYLDEEVNA